MCTQAEKELAQELVFEYYYDRNDMDFEIAIEEIIHDIVRLEEHEQYERCQMLKDILERFE
jgi:hypothetical protein